jgi:hypothetical protein
MSKESAEELPRFLQSRAQFALTEMFPGFRRYCFVILTSFRRARALVLFQENRADESSTTFRNAL